MKCPECRCEEDFHRTIRTVENIIVGVLCLRCALWCDLTTPGCFATDDIHIEQGIPQREEP
jgi:hypothetical protein